MRSALIAFVVGVCGVAFGGEEAPSVLNHGAPPAATTTVACAENCERTEVCSTTRCRNRCGLVRRAARGTVEVSRTVVRTVTRPVARVRGACCCN